MRKQIRLNINGMTCVNCQNKLEKGLRKAKGIMSAEVSYNDGTADIVYNEDIISVEAITEIIEKLDYEVVSGNSAADLTNLISLLAIIVALYVMLQKLGLLNRLIPGQLADEGMGCGMLFVIGLLTSVHCIAMCGGINLSQALPQRGGDSQSRKVFWPAFSYNMGRVCSYTAIGFVLGLVGLLLGGGAEVGLSALLQGILKIIAGLFMVIMGINMLGLFPQLRKLTLRTPRFMVQKIGRGRAKTNRPFLIGMLNGLMPCGPLQSMWIVALATGNPFSGALSMFLFSLGTVPLMLGLGSIVSVLGRRFADAVMKAGAVLVTVLGLAMLSQGGALSGWISPQLLLVLIIAFCVVGVLCSIPVRKKTTKYMLNAVSAAILIGSCAAWQLWGTAVYPASASENGAKTESGVQIVNSTLAPGKYPDITVQAGIPVKWVIEAPEGSVNGCNYKLLIQDYGIEHTFQTGENVIEFTPTKARTVRYSCWMGMIRGNIFVTE